MSRNFAQILLHYASHAVHAASFFRGDFLSAAGKGAPDRVDELITKLCPAICPADFDQTAGPGRALPDSGKSRLVPATDPY